MNFEKFYIKPKYIKLINGISPDIDKYSIYEVNLTDIFHLALFATTLEPLQEIKLSLGYTLALDQYYKYNTNEYAEYYSKITSNSEGQSILCTTIELCLLEKKFRNEEINKKDLLLYNKFLDEYRKQVELNNLIYKVEKQKTNSVY